MLVFTVNGVKYGLVDGFNRNYPDYFVLPRILIKMLLMITFLFQVRNDL